MKRIFPLIALFFYVISALQAQNQALADVAVTVPRPYVYADPAPFKGVQIKTQYVTMPDSVKLAVDVYLPKNYVSGTRLPVLLHQTRYWRGPQLRWPFSMFSNGLKGRYGKAVTTFVENGYAFVNVDVRGSGASGGSREYPWSPPEVSDGTHILDWIVAQPWCNGNIGSLGGSYSGTAAEFLASTRHPNLKAVALMYSLFDVYDDIAFPGGVHFKWFTDNWGEANSMLDQNKLPTKSFKAHLAVKGVRKVKGQGKVLREAIKSHHANKSVSETVADIQFRDSKSSVAGVGPEDFSPYHVLDAIRKSKIAIYCYSGWFDGPYQHASIRRWLNLHNFQDVRLTIGPWEHGGSYNLSPFSRAEAGFDHTGEMLKFFDQYLKNEGKTTQPEPKVHYYTMGEEAWHANETWPPTAKMEEWYFDHEGKLSSKKPSKGGTVEIKANNQFGTGTQTRWRSLMTDVNQTAYADWNQRSAPLTHFETDTLAQNMEITGHPEVEFCLTSSSVDGDMHVYLEDVDENGQAIYVSEGLIRLPFHKEEYKNKPYYDIVTQHAYREKDFVLLNPGQLYRVRFDILPTSYLFLKGHKLRVSIATADRDHFRSYTPDDAVWSLSIATLYPSKIYLPVVQSE
ncbi:MAG: CocE/NonD family hydrolase [Bacteroidia bacterium]|nr:CocE/NonD family hydrolase [Bacteroidia bacterium]